MVLTAIFPALMLCCVFYCKFGVRFFCSLKQLLLSWERRLNEDLAAVAQSCPLDRKQQACKSPNDDRFLESESTELSPECRGEVLQILASCRLEYSASTFEADLMQKQNSSCCLLHGATSRVGLVGLPEPTGFEVMKPWKAVMQGSLICFASQPGSLCQNHLFSCFKITGALRSMC